MVNRQSVRIVLMATALSVAAMGAGVCSKAEQTKGASSSPSAMEPVGEPKAAPRQVGSPARPSRPARPARPVAQITRKADLSGLKIALPATWSKEKASKGHWIVQSPGPSYKSTMVILKPSAPGGPTTAKAMLARLKTDAQFLDEGFTWAGSAKTTPLKGGFLLEGRQRYRGGGSSEPAFVVLRKLSVGWMTCWAPRLASPSHQARAIQLCSRARTD